jgi:hypothetical protein
MHLRGEIEKEIRRGFCWCDRESLLDQTPSTLFPCLEERKRRISGREIKKRRERRRMEREGGRVSV